MARSSDEEQQGGSRTTRMYRAQKGWYFRTREGNPVGPFRDELEASTHLEVYIRLLDADLVPGLQEEKPAPTRNTA